MTFLHIKTIHTPDDIARCFKTFLELRPHLTTSDAFIAQLVLQQKEGYQIAALEHKGDFVACTGFRILTTLAWGKILYIDDIIAQEKYRGKGYGHQLLEYAVDFAKKNGCQQVHLDTGYARHIAHKVYLNHGFEINCHHLALKFS